MNQWNPGIARPWSASDLEEILGEALRVLEEIGVECAHERTRDCLAEWGGVAFAGERIRFSSERVREHLERKRTLSGKSPVEEVSDFGLGGCWAGLNYCDPETGAVRPASTRDAADMARLWDGRGRSGVVPLIPGDVPPRLVTLAAEWIALTHSRYLGGSLTVTDPEEIRLLIDMNLAAGRRYRLMQQVGISPLRFNAEGLETAIGFFEYPDVEVNLGGFIPMAGATCPLDPRSAVVQAAAESLAFDVTCWALGFGDGGLEIRVEPFDFQYSAIVFGSPEWCLYRALALQMSEYLSGRRVRNGSFRTVAKRPDVQAMCERTASALWQALLGIRQFGAVGQLSVDEVFSPQQAVLDREILGYVARVIDGLDGASEEVDAVALIGEGVEQGGFIGVDDTTHRFRDFYRFPELFRHWSVGRWRAEEEPSILAEAWECAREEMRLSTFALEEDRQAEVDRLYSRGQSYVREGATRK